MLRSLFRPSVNWLCRWIAACGMLVATLCQAESPFLIDVWTPYEGLPQSRVLDITQTPDGYLWIATKLGWLARFDGRNFANFNPDNTPALSSPELQKLILDDAGTLWIADIDGHLISYSGGIFENRLEGMPGYSNRIVGWLGHDGNENRFVTASGGLLRVTGQGHAYENETNPPPGNPESIRQFCQDSEGVIWCCTTAGVLGRWTDGHFQPEPGLPDLQATKVNYLLAADGGGLWLATEDGLWRRESDTTHPVLPTLPGNQRKIKQLARNADGSLWLRTTGGLILVRDGTIVHTSPLTGIAASPQLRHLDMYTDSSGGAWVIKYGSGVWHVDSDGIATALSTRNGLPDDQVETWFEDREKNIWLGTAGGLVRLRPRWFQVIEPGTAANGSGITSIGEDEGGDIWLGRANGLSRWRDGVSEDIPWPPTRSGFPIADVTVSPTGPAGQVWLGTVQSGAMLLRDGQIEHPFPPLAPGEAIRVIRRDPEGGLWLGGEFGLFRWDGKTLRKFGPEDGLSSGHIHDISFDDRGTVWIAKAEDLLVTYQDGRFTPVPLPGISRSTRIYTVLCGAGGDVFLGTVGAGLLHLTGGKLQHYTTDDGLPGNSVSQLLIDDADFLWGGTHRGLFRVSISDLKSRSMGVLPPFMFQSYGYQDGLPSAECSGGLQPACKKARDGRLWFSTAVGALRIDPLKVTKNLYPPTVVIEQMRVDDQALPLGGKNPGPARHSIVPGRHRYEFQFTGLSFTTPGKVGFQWRMSGVDTDWVDGGSQRSVAYSGLLPGNYQFSVRAHNNDGIWSLSPAAISFQVAPFFWQRPLVQSALGFAGVGALYFFVAGVMRRKHLRELRHFEYERSLEQQRFRHKQAMETERARIAAELHDDLGANLTQIQWLGDAANQVHDGTPGGNEILSRIATKSREMVRLIDEIVWAVNPKNDTLDQLVTYVCNFAEQYFRDSPTRARIDVASEIPNHLLEADVRHHLFLLAKEALHNVAKHAHTDRVWIRISSDDAVFKLLIEDRGHGFDPASADAGDGLANMRRRAQQAGAELSIESAPGHGTQVTLLLPLTPTTA